MFCKKCGAQIENGQKFCKACGAKIDYSVSKSLYSDYSALQDRYKSQAVVNSTNKKAISFSSNKTLGILMTVFYAIMGVLYAFFCLWFAEDTKYAYDWIASDFSKIIGWLIYFLPAVIVVIFCIYGILLSLNIKGLADIKNKGILFSDRNISNSVGMIIFCVFFIIGGKLTENIESFATSKIIAHWVFTCHAAFSKLLFIGAVILFVLSILRTVISNKNSKM